MKPLVAFLILGAALVLLAAVAVGAMISLSAGRPSWVLIGVFVVDSVAIVLIAGHLVLRRRDGSDQ